MGSGDRWAAARPSWFLVQGWVYFFKILLFKNYGHVCVWGFSAHVSASTKEGTRSPGGDIYQRL